MNNQKNERSVNSSLHVTLRPFRAA